MTAPRRIGTTALSWRSPCRAAAASLIATPLNQALAELASGSGAAERSLLLEIAALEREAAGSDTAR